MKARIRSISSPDIDIQGYVSGDSQNDGFLLTVYAGPGDGPGEESFDVLVCTPAWLGALVRRDGPQVGRHRLIVEPMDIEVAIGFLRRTFESVEGATWREVAEKLARIGHWEFEDYQP